MAEALRAARRGLHRTHPNPAVGAVIVRGGKLLSRGWHRAAGKPHAEIEALRGLKSASDARGATLYVTLEPCSTHGRTPPCTDAILAAGFARVVWGATDPNPAHRGRAADILNSAGIETEVGVMGPECAELNAGWNHWIVTGTPLVIAKFGMSLDGRIAGPPGGPRWITSAASRRDAMKLRATVDAVLVGGNTVRTDNPFLTVRPHPVNRLQPLRVIWTKSGRLPGDSHVFTDEFSERTRVFHDKPLCEVVEELGRGGVKSVLIEGGAETLGAAFDAGLVHRVQIYLAGVLLGGPVPAIGGLGSDDWQKCPPLRNVRYFRIGNDIRMTGECGPLTQMRSETC